MSAKMKTPAKRAKKKEAASGPKMVLGWVAQAVPQNGQPAWDVVLIPEGSKTDFEKNPTVPGRWFRRVVGPATSAAAVKQAREVYAKECGAGVVAALVAVALLILTAGAEAGDTRERGSREDSRETRDSTDWSRDTRESTDWSSDWTGGGHQSVPEPGNVLGVLLVAGMALMVRRRRKGGAL